ncbi:MAG: hypothetical protein FJW38_26980 [Acidobacteria bacterium]|nr:hypothetical protein [Acidobacteriota bacterium]
MKRPFAASVWKEGKWYVAQCLEIDVASHGATSSTLRDPANLADYYRGGGWHAPENPQSSTP